MQSKTYHQIIHKLQTIYQPYGVRLYERHGATYPLTVDCTDMDVIIDDILTPQPPYTERRTADLPFYNYDLIPSIQAQGKRLYNGVTFTFDRLETNPLQVHGQLGNYFDHLTTCVMLEDELTNKNTYPYRETLHNIVPPYQLMTNGNGRSTALGVGTLTVFRDQDATYKLILAERSASTAHKGGAIHVAPAFIFQPSGKSYPTHEWSLLYQIKREYVEELFNVAEMEDGNTDFMKSQPAQQFDAMLADGRASIHFTGMVLNLLTTQVAFCSLILIHDDQWFNNRIGQSAWEMNGLHIAPVTTDNVLLNALPNDAYMQLTPVGAASMWLGVDRARRILGIYTRN